MQGMMADLGPAPDRGDSASSSSNSKSSRRFASIGDLQEARLVMNLLLEQLTKHHVAQRKELENKMASQVE